MATVATRKTAADTTSTPQPFSAMLSRLYFARFAFAVVWAALLIPSGKHTGAALTVLLVVYPLVDAAAVLWQLRSKNRPSGPAFAEWANVLVSVGVAITLGWASTSSIGTALAVWGAWAAASGITQLTTAISHRTAGGQIPLIISGAISTLAGASFLAQSAKDPSSISAIGGYAILGGIFFLISAIRLRSQLRTAAH
ncbi:integral membrane protein [Catenulispora acidiphila DSM 44928]|uniref:Integral membrane protein n=1 Tax=Catenulispora acidiphila (strain DSM 44928 / JCM 14897 / NBRC 102108 / NRRL B-24433 / ID139908) TaxID=479433 RepID=C7Q4A4_CATAD|nr:integral membrane protein [Catenulispora acidiphila]ACU69964.1 integral membrane protein [Catenulispora acidiphila DSM 44928]